MSVPRTARIASIIEKRRPLVQKIESVEANLNNLASALRKLEEHRNELMTRVDDPNIRERLKEINFSTIQPSISTEINFFTIQPSIPKALEALAKLRVRFSRDRLNIGVVGRARQGKSRLLQSLTGLTAVEIPDGDSQHCTGVRSTIRHESNVETYGEVWFHSEQSFLNEVIALYYKELCLGVKPMTLQEFASQPVPPLPSHVVGAELGAKYKHLQRYHTHFDKYRHLLQVYSPRRISRNEIREYVAQDNLKGEAVFFNYLAVREVKIVCMFPNADIGQIALVDMPGLGDTGIGDQERVIETLGKDVDFVLFVRKPNAAGDYWGDVDVKLYDIAASALGELPINLWSFMVLNQTSAGPKNGDNSNNCQDLLRTIAEKHIFVKKCVIANCANSEEANTKILDTALDYLADNITSLDKQYASASHKWLIQLQKEVKAELEKAGRALGQAIQQEKEFSKFTTLFNEFWYQITDSLEKLLKTLRNQREQEDIEFKKKVEEVLKTCRTDTGLPILEKIEIRANAEGGLIIAYNKYLNEIRAHLSQHFLSLDEGLTRSLDGVKSQIATVLIEKGRLGGLTDAKNADFIQEFVKVLPDQIIAGKSSKVKFGFQVLAEFELSYRGLIQHRIRQHLDILTPDEATALGLSSTSSAEQVLANLKTAQAEAVYKCQNALEELLCEPSQAVFAIVEEFLDRILRAADVKDEWRIFLKNVQFQIWPSEFEQLSQQTQIRREWQQAVDTAAANNSNSMQFLSE